MPIFLSFRRRIRQSWLAEHRVSESQVNTQVQEHAAIEEATGKPLRFDSQLRCLQVDESPSSRRHRHWRTSLSGLADPTTVDADTAKC